MSIGLRKYIRAWVGMGIGVLVCWLLLRLFLGEWVPIPNYVIIPASIPYVCCVSFNRHDVNSINFTSSYDNVLVAVAMVFQVVVYGLIFHFLPTVVRDIFRAYKAETSKPKT